MRKWTLLTLVVVLFVAVAVLAANGQSHCPPPDLPCP
jgi:hypothetical protein